MTNEIRLRLIDIAWEMAKPRGHAEYEVDHEKLQKTLSLFTQAYRGLVAALEDTPDRSSTARSGDAYRSPAEGVRA